MRIGSILLMLLLVSIQLLLAADSRSQTMDDVSVTLELKNESLASAIKKVERQSGFLFSYQTQQVAPYKRISLEMAVRSVRQTLTLILAKTNLSFRQEGNYIIIFRNDKAETNPRKAEVEAIGVLPVTLTGIVMNAQGEPLQGVSIVVKGTKNGTTTDAKGYFSLVVPGKGGLVLEISAVGFAPQEYAVNGATDLRVILKNEVSSLNDAVVIGYGEQRKINLTGSVVTLDEAEIENRGVANISAVLAGQAAGLTVVQSGGAPGRDAGTLNIHGIGTLGVSSPLIVVDGIKTDSYTQIDPDDIQSISVLKDAASSAIYGIDAANGVIIITTKRGRKGKLKVDYNFKYGGSKYVSLPQKVNSWDLATMYDSAQADDGAPASGLLFSPQDIQEFKDGSSPLTHANSNWIKAIFPDPGRWMSHTLALSGGTDDTKYNISFGYTDQGGLMESTGYKKYNFRANIDQRISDRLSGGVNLAFTQGNISDPPTVLGVGGESWYIHEAFQMWATDPIYTSNGTYSYPIWSGLNSNPVAYASSANGYYLENDNRLVGTAFAELKIINGLSLKGVGSTTRDYDFYSDLGLGVNLYPVNPATGQPSPDPNNTSASMPATPSTTSVYRGDFQNYENTLQVLLNYNRGFGLHHVTGLLGYEVVAQTQEQEDITRNDLSSTALNQINAASPLNQTTDGNTIQYRTQSVFGRATYNYDSRYLLEVDGREDASSRFAPGHRAAYFPSFSAGWVVSKEKFYNFSPISTLKFRYSWGILGNQQINNYLYEPTYALGSNYLFNGVLNSGITEGPLANPDITWEKTTNSTEGMDIGLLQDKLQLSFEYYLRNTNNILLQLNQPAILGATPPETNAGSVSNKGYDFTLAYRNRIGKVGYYLNGNFNFVKNRITNLAGTGYPGREVGDPIDNIYGYVAEGLFQNEAQIQKHADQSALGGTPQPGDISYKDLNGDGVVNSSDEKDLGTYFPQITYGFSFGANYLGFDLSTVWSGDARKFSSIAGSRLSQPFGDYGSSPITPQLDSWSPENPNAPFPRLSLSSTYNYVVSSYWVKNTSFLKLRNAQIGYTLPAALIKTAKISKVRIYFSGENLLTISSFRIMDPESITFGDPLFAYSGTAAYPTTKKFLAGVSITF